MPSEEKEDKVNRRTSESRIKLACIMPSEEKEDEVNRRTSESRIKFACIMPSEEKEDEVNRRTSESKIKLALAFCNKCSQGPPKAADRRSDYFDDIKENYANRYIQR